MNETFCIIQYIPRALVRHNTDLCWFSIRDGDSYCFQERSMPAHQNLLNEALEMSPHPFSLSSLPKERDQPY